MTFEVATISPELAHVVSDPVFIDSSGHTLTRSWAAIPGATSMRVGSSSLSVHPATSSMGRNVGVVVGARSGVNKIRVPVKPNGALVRSIHIANLQYSSEESTRIAVAPVVNGAAQAPTHTVPAVHVGGSVPDQLKGATFNGSLLKLPDVAATALDITVVTKSEPSEFQKVNFSHGDVTLYVAPGPIGLSIVGPDGQEQSAHPGPLTSSISVDLTAVMKRHLGNPGPPANPPTPPTAELKLNVTSPGSATLFWYVSGMVIERALPEPVQVTCSGRPAVLALPAPDPGVNALRTLCDITVDHHGRQLHPISDPVPPIDAGVGGPAVRGTAVTRSLPPQGLAGESVVAVAVIGWPMGSTDLAVSIGGSTSSLQGLEAPEARSSPMVAWIELDEPIPGDRVTEVSLTATRGAFAWVANPSPLVQVAVASEPAGKSVSVAGLGVTLTGKETHLGGLTLGGPVSHAGVPGHGGGRGWLVQTNQFCDVRLSDVTLEFGA